LSEKPESLPMRVLLPLFGVVAIDAIGMGIVLPLLPFYSQHFGATPLVLGALVAVFSLGQFVTAPVLGKLSDRFGRKSVLLVSQAGTLLSFLMLASAGSLGMLFVARLLAGAATGNISVASAFAADHSTPQTRRRAIGLIAAGMGVGMMIGPSLSAALAPVSITTPIWAAVLLASGSLVVNLVFLKDDRKNIASSDVRAGRSLWQAVRSPGTLSVLAVLTLFYFAFAMWVSQFALFLQARYVWNGSPFGPREVGFIFAASGAINIFVQAVAMKRFERVFPESLLVVVSLSMFAVGMGLITLAPGMQALAVGLVLASLGTALSRPTLMAALSLTSSPHQQGALMGASASLMAVCNVVAPLLAGALIDGGRYLVWSATIATIMGAGACMTLVSLRSHRWPSSHAAASNLAERVS